MQEQSVGLSLLEIFQGIWKRKWWMVVMAILFGLVTFLYTSFIAQRLYTSTTRLYVVNRTTQEVSGGLSNQDLLAGSELTKDYKEIILSDDVLDKTISDLALSLDEAQLKGKITVDIPDDTRIISISVTDKDKKEAARIANGIRTIAAEKIIAVTKVMDVTTLQEARVPNQASSPNVRRQTIVATVVGFFGTMFVVLIHEFLDTRLKRRDDIERMGVAILGNVPYVSSEK